MSSLSQLQNKFNALENREQKLLITGFLVVAIFLIYSLVYKPMNDSISRLEQNNIKNQELLVWMSQSVASLKGVTANSNVDKRRGRSMNVIINTTSSRAKVSISRSQPRDNNQYQIWIEKVNFNDLLLWLDVLQKDYAIFVSNINLGTTDNKGQVRVNLTFQDSGS